MQRVSHEMMILLRAHGASVIYRRVLSRAILWYFVGGERIVRAKMRMEFDGAARC